MRGLLLLPALALVLATSACPYQAGDTPVCGDRLLPSGDACVLWPGACGCSSDERCGFDGTATACVTPGTQGIDAPCTDDSVCAAGTVCDGTRCRQACFESLDCGTGQAIACLALEDKGGDHVASICHYDWNPTSPQAPVDPNLETCLPTESCELDDSANPDCNAKVARGWTAPPARRSPLRARLRLHRGREQQARVRALLLGGEAHGLHRRAEVRGDHVRERNLLGAVAPADQRVHAGGVPVKRPIALALALALVATVGRARAPTITLADVVGRDPNDTVQRRCLRRHRLRDALPAGAAVRPARPVPRAVRAQDRRREGDQPVALRLRVERGRDAAARHRRLLAAGRQRVQQRHEQRRALRSACRLRHQPEAQGARRRISRTWSPTRRPTSRRARASP